VSRPRMLLAALSVAALSGCGPLGSSNNDPKAVVPDKVKMEGVLQPKDAKVVDLHGLDKPQKLSGGCFSEYVLVAGGIDSTGQQRFVLSFHLQGDPKDEPALYQLLAKNSCGKQQQEIHDKAAKVVGYVSGGRTADPIDISYLTTSGRRLFL
jgi:hypothetical protein